MCVKKLQSDDSAFAAVLDDPPLSLHDRHGLCIPRYLLLRIHRHKIISAFLDRIPHPVLFDVSNLQVGARIEFGYLRTEGDNFGAASFSEGRGVKTAGGSQKSESGGRGKRES